MQSVVVFVNAAHYGWRICLCWHHITTFQV